MNNRNTVERAEARAIGNRLAPWRFLLFLGLAVVAVPTAMMLTDWRHGLMIGFDIASAGFLLAVISLFDDRIESMRLAALRNDANRVLLLAITIGVMLVVLAAVAAELSQQGKPNAMTIALVVGTLALAWTFSNVVYALHYGHMYYLEKPAGGDRGGLEIPHTPEPNYWDFLYFACTLGMTFQTSDVQITSRAVRRVALFHSLAAFVFNLGIIAFSINVLGGG